MRMNVSLDLRSWYDSRLPEGLLRGRQTLLRDWVIIKVAFGFTEKQAVDRRLIEMGFAPLVMERYFSGPSLVIRFPENAWPCLWLRVNHISGFSEQGTRKGVELETRMTTSPWDRHISWGKGIAYDMYSGSFDEIIRYIRESIWPTRVHYRLFT